MESYERSNQNLTPRWVFNLISAEMNLVGNYRTLRGLRTVNPEGLRSTRSSPDWIPGPALNLGPAPILGPRGCKRDKTLEIYFEIKCFSLCLGGFHTGMCSSGVSYNNRNPALGILWSWHRVASPSIEIPIHFCFLSGNFDLWSHPPMDHKETTHLVT